MTPDRLEAAFARFKGTRIAVVGDLMLDEYVWGDVARISPDAPVQVVEIARRSHTIGGAGNVANNVVASGGSASLFGVVGPDAAGEVLPRLLEEAGIDAKGVVREEGRPTTVKTRVVARGQHVLRLDEEVRSALRAETRERLLSALGAVLPECGAILVSDYAKGVVDSRLVADIAALVAAQAPGIPIIVDPKTQDLSRYAGCFAITPNSKESEAAARMAIASEEDLVEAARRIRESSGARCVLITRGEKGMALSQPDGRLDLIAAQAREIYDVTGAGDIVMAYLGMGLATGLPPLEAASLANLAAGIGVRKVGTTAVAPSEILASELTDRKSPGKVMDLGAAVARLGHERSLGRRIVFTNGCFDLLHAGHVQLLEQARALGDFMVVAANSDASVRRLKGDGRPLLSETDRVKILAALDAVDLVLIFEEDTPLEVIRKVRPDVLVKGGDYEPEKIVGYDFVCSYGGRVQTIPLVTGRSTTALIAAMKSERPGPR